LDDHAQAGEPELVRVRWLPQPVEWYIGDTISFRFAFGNVVHVALLIGSDIAVWAA
jgi:hypothetical protein